MKKTILVALMATTLFACKQNETKTETNATTDDGIATFKENIKHTEAGFKAFASNNLTEWASYVSDTAKFNGPNFGDSVVGKATEIERLTAFHKLHKNVVIKSISLVPSVDSVTLKPDGNVRAYVIFSSESKINGAKLEFKFYGYYKSNSDHKLVEADEYSDGTGVLNAAMAPKK
jgi:hypothetical protein